MKKFKFLTFLLILTFIIAGCANEKNSTVQSEKKKVQDERVEMTLSAAISLTDALEEIKKVYEKEHNVKLTYILGGSGKLAQQIQQGAPVDVFFSANQDWMDTLEKENLLINETRQDITGNKIMLITGKSSAIDYKSVDDIAADDIEQIAIGNPESVPAGQYTEQLLQKLDKWSALESKIVLAQDVRQVLTYVETGNVDIGFVYESDAITSKDIKVLATVDSSLHDPIIYPAAVLRDTKHEQEASEFVKFMTSDEAQAILEKHGFRK